MAAKSKRTPTSSQGFENLRRQSLISGFVLRLARESVPDGCSQERLAELIWASPDTVAGWETGRRPLSAVKAGHFIGLKALLTRCGAAPHLIKMLDTAMEADQLLDHIRRPDGRHEPGSFHPLGAYVHRREVIELVAWPISGRPPAGLITPTRPARRGPVATSPELNASEREAAFDHLRRIVETSAGNDGLLQRQALYLQSFDRRPDAAAWMADRYRRVPRRRTGWTPQWPVARTLSVALVRYGDPGPLIDFSDFGLANESGHVANLNYWAYWLGEGPHLERDDHFMPIRLGSWRGHGILRHLADRLDTQAGVADLGIRTLRDLLVARPRLVDEDRPLADTLADDIEHLMDGGGTVPTATRQALAEIQHALQLRTR